MLDDDILTFDVTKIAQPLAEAVRTTDADIVAGDCHLANGAILQETGTKPIHPIQVLARAYGIEPE